MEKKDLVQFIDNILRPFGFKKKGNYWRLDGDEIIKIVNLQKSQWSNQYYINYGFDFKNLEYDGVTMHIFRRIDSNDIDGKNILDFENTISDNRSKLIETLLNKILSLFSRTNSVTDIISDLKQQSHLNDITAKVKEFLGLPT